MRQYLALALLATLALAGCGSKGGLTLPPKAVPTTCLLYTSRAAFLLDRLMGTVGLSGRSFIPLLSSFACAIPGIMAARTISNWRDRLATIMIAPLMTCSARLPVYALIIGAFIPQTMVGVFNLQGLVSVSYTHLSRPARRLQPQRRQHRRGNHP